MTTESKFIAGLVELDRAIARGERPLGWLTPRATAAASTPCVVATQAGSRDQVAPRGPATFCSVCGADLTGQVHFLMPAPVCLKHNQRLAENCE